VLEVLSKGAQVLVTTHDVELQNSLASCFDLYHFLENPDIDGFFDYQLRAGATVERNAIRLLGRMGFPEDVVGRALEYSKPGAPPP
jgi:DNA mismatch repair ATPase MutS